MSIMKYLGPVVTLVMMIGSAALALWFAFGNALVGRGASATLGATTAMTMMAVGCGLLVVKSDWPRVWKPLFVKK